MTLINLFLFKKAGFQNNVNIDHKLGLLVGGFNAAVFTTSFRATGDFSGHWLYSSFLIVVIQTYDLGTLAS